MKDFFLESQMHFQLFSSIFVPPIIQIKKYICLPSLSGVINQNKKGYCLSPCK